MIVLSRVLWIALGFAGLIAVGTGAYGAHTAGFNTVAHDRFASALLYHLVHLSAMTGALLLSRQKTQLLAMASAGLFLLGMILFSGSLYASAFSGGATSTMLAPYGGMSLMLGWLTLGFAGARSVSAKL